MYKLPYDIALRGFRRSNGCGEVKCLTQGHTASKWDSPDLNTASSHSQSPVLSAELHVQTRPDCREKASKYRKHLNSAFQSFSLGHMLLGLESGVKRFYCFENRAAWRQGVLDIYILTNNLFLVLSWCVKSKKAKNSYMRT